MDIGIATLEYDDKGNVTSVNFEPSIKTSLDELTPQLRNVRGSDSEDLRHNAELVLSSWFNKVGEVELADRENYKIESKTEECLKYENGTVKKCVIRFVLTRL